MGKYVFPHEISLKKPAITLINPSVCMCSSEAKLDITRNAFWCVGVQVVNFRYISWPINMKLSTLKMPQNNHWTKLFRVLTFVFVVILPFPCFLSFGRFPIELAPHLHSFHPSLLLFLCHGLSLLFLCLIFHWPGDEKIYIHYYGCLMINRPLCYID